MIVNMREKIKDKINKKDKSTIIIFLLLIITILFGIFVGISFSRYESEVNGKGMIEIAKPIIEIERQQSILTQVTAQNPKATCTFEINNYSGSNLNEVEMEYYIEIISNTDNLIEFELFKDGQLLQLSDNKTKKIKLVKGEIQSDKYILNITYNSQKNKTNQDISQNVEIKVHSIQGS